MKETMQNKMSYTNLYTIQENTIQPILFYTKENKSSN